MSLYYPSRLWKNWQEALIIVQPETVKWHREGFRLYWRWKSRALSDGRRPTLKIEN
jgi:hypothetical protein